VLQKSIPIWPEALLLLGENIGQLNLKCGEAMGLKEI
jgi:hypothetical protein